MSSFIAQSRKPLRKAVERSSIGLSKEIWVSPKNKDYTIIRGPDGRFIKREIGERIFSRASSAMMGREPEPPEPKPEPETEPGLEPEAGAVEPGAGTPASIPAGTEAGAPEEVGSAEDGRRLAEPVPGTGKFSKLRNIDAVANSVLSIMMQKAAEAKRQGKESEADLIEHACIIMSKELSSKYDKALEGEISVEEFRDAVADAAIEAGVADLIRGHEARLIEIERRKAELAAASSSPGGKPEAEVSEYEEKERAAREIAKAAKAKASEYKQQGKVAEAVNLEVGAIMIGKKLKQLQESVLSPKVKSKLISKILLMQFDILPEIEQIAAPEIKMKIKGERLAPKDSDIAIGGAGAARAPGSAGAEAAPQEYKKPDFMYEYSHAVNFWVHSKSRDAHKVSVAAKVWSLSPSKEAEAAAIEKLKEELMSVMLKHPKLFGKTTPDTLWVDLSKSMEVSIYDESLRAYVIEGKGWNQVPYRESLVGKSYSKSEARRAKYA